eukprot:3736049-Rhodomonas_salina.6
MNWCPTFWRFVFRTIVHGPVSNECASVIVPVRSPAVIATCSVRSTPLATLHSIVVSETQPVPSHPVHPTLAVALLLDADK